MDEESRKRLEELKNKHVMEIVDKYVALCKPAKVTVLKNSKEDAEYLRKKAIEQGEESHLATEGHTFHFDGINDQARDGANTKVLMPKGKKLSPAINVGDRDACLREITHLLDGIMKGKDMFVSFYCLGPQDSHFSLLALQMTDSAYVLHSEDMLYRPGYEMFRQLNGSSKFFHFIHSAGELDERKNTKNVGERRVYMDLVEKRVFSINNQYAGNSVGLKKLALRLAIHKSNHEDWLCEHMFLMGVSPEGKGRTTFFTGAFPSGCGKTSTAMVPGQTIIGDDIAYLRIGDDGIVYGVNVEQGIFGIIEDVNPIDDPLIYQTLTTKREIIFSNVLINNNQPYWLGMGKDIPLKGENFSGQWEKGKKDANEKDIPAAHKNARYTIRIEELPNADPNLHNPGGVPVSGIIYGGRDSDTSPPVVESLGWAHGVFIGAALESETTAQKIGQEGVRVHNPMSNLEFLVVPLSLYIKNHLAFGERADKKPKIFATNYFLKDNGRFLNEKVDKKVWLMWMEGRIHGEYGKIETPIGFIPKYDDLKSLFRKIFDKEYTKEEYNSQFALRIDKLLARLDRIEGAYQEEEDIPQKFSDHVSQQRIRLQKAKQKTGKGIILPEEFVG